MLGPEPLQSRKFYFHRSTVDYRTTQHADLSPLLRLLKRKVGYRKVPMQICLYSN